MTSVYKKKDSNEYVFNNNGKKLNYFKRSLYTACKNAGFKDMHIHDQRHVFASKMIKSGTPLFTVGKLLGHKKSSTTERYAHLIPETLKKAVDDVWGKK